jgi:hypothetical protein
MITQIVNAGLTSTLEYKVKSSIQCNANHRGGSTITSATIHDLEENGKYLIFSGSFEGRNFFSYTGSFHGKAKVVGDEIRISELYFSNALDKDVPIRNACMR